MLAQIGVHRDYARGETIFAVADESVACATLITGAVKLSRFDAQGTERIVAIVHPAGLLGALFAHQEDLHATALTDSHMCVVPRSLFENLIEKRPALTRAILDHTLEALRETQDLVDLIGRRDARARVAGLLLAFAHSASQKPCAIAERFELPLTRGEIAGMLGLTIETVSRQFTRLEHDQLIAREGARGVVIQDSDALRHQLT